MSEQSRKLYASTVDERVRENEEQLFFFQIYAEPESDNPESEEYGGAYVTGWVDADTLVEAESTLLQAIEEDGWRPIRLEHYDLVCLRDYSPSHYSKEELAQFAECFEEAREEALSMIFHVFPIADEADDASTSGGE